MEEPLGQILVVDDNRMNRQKLSITLRNQGYAVELAEGGQEALDMLRATPFDVVLLDILMPEMDGYEVLEQIKADPTISDIPVIVISALDDIDSVVRGIEMGAVDYLPKSFNPVMLQARINSSLQKKNLRDLEKAYLEQEMTLRQSEKLATLGRLSAGIAHELNNPAAATRRGAAQLLEALPRVHRTHEQLRNACISTETIAGFIDYEDQMAKEKPDWYGDLLLRSDHESELADWLAELGVADSWDVAQVLTDLGISRRELLPLTELLSQEQLGPAIEWLYSDLLVQSLGNLIRESAGRVSDIVTALKSYSYMDQAPVQNVDIHEGLNNTLVMLRSKIDDTITVSCSFEPRLPRIQGHGADLNQVWTHLIENAIEAMSDGGELNLRTRMEDNWAIVDVEDTGPGIPPEIHTNIFDPFFTTKPPGEGVGLGLNIAHNIIVQKHGGRIDVHSTPGQTRFEVRLSQEASP